VSGGGFDVENPHMVVSPVGKRSDFPGKFNANPAGLVLLGAAFYELRSGPAVGLLEGKAETTKGTKVHEGKVISVVSDEGSGLPSCSFVSFVVSSIRALAGCGKTRFPGSLAQALKAPD
jgi:hypothetical protein